MTATTTATTTTTTTTTTTITTTTTVYIQHGPNSSSGRYITYITVDFSYQEQGPELQQNIKT